MRVILNIAIAILLFVCIKLSAQPQMRVQGTITSEETGDPIFRVQIMRDSIWSMAETDIDGKFSIMIERDAILYLRHHNYNDYTMEIRGQQLINIKMKERSLNIGEVVVMGERSKKKISVEPTEIEIKGNYFHITTAFGVPVQLFKTDHRFIVQPTILDVTRKRRYNLRPVVIDGDNYSTVQHRYMGFGESQDKLVKYRVENNFTRKEYMYRYSDSLYFDPKNINNDFKADCYLLLASYQPPHVYQDSVTIAKGTQNILRFFDYSLSPMSLGGAIIDSMYQLDNLILQDDCDIKYIPKPELNLMTDKGVAKITFAVNKTTFDTSIEENAQSLEKITKLLKDIQSNPDADLKSISMTGYASPEGQFASNQQLANKRTQSLLQYVTQAIHPDLRPYIKLEHKGVVQKWSALVDLIEPDNPALAAKIKAITDETKDDFTKSQQKIARLPEYRSVIMPYISQLRKVEYFIDYTMFRQLTDEEIKERFELSKSGRADIDVSRFEYYKLVKSEPNRAKREEIENIAVKKFPNFTWMVNRKAIRDILRDSSSLETLKPVLKTYPPVAATYNQVLTSLQQRNITIADSLMMRIPQEVRDSMGYAQAVIDALSGDYQSAYKEIAKRGGMNEVLILLGMKENKFAQEAMLKVLYEGENQYEAKCFYVLATCYKRLDQSDASAFGNAVTALDQAIMFDPDMANIAKIDSDIIEVYEFIVARDNPQEETSILDGMSKKKKTKAPKETKEGKEPKAPKGEKKSKKDKTTEEEPKPAATKSEEPEFGFDLLDDPEIAALVAEPEPPKEEAEKKKKEKKEKVEKEKKIKEPKQKKEKSEETEVNE